MIDIALLRPKDIGRWVTYRSSGGDKVENGRIKSWNDTGIFVVYNESAQQDDWQNYTGAHTKPEDLTWLYEPTEPKPSYNNVTVIGKDRDEKPTFKAHFKQAPGGWIVFTVSSPEALTEKQLQRLAGTYASLARLAKREPTLEEAAKGGPFDGLFDGDRIK